MKKYLSKITIAILIALVSTLAFALPALASEARTPHPPIAIVKDLDIPRGTTSPQLVFEFGLTQVTPATGQTAPGAVPGVTFQPVHPPTVTMPAPRPSITFVPNASGLMETSFDLTEDFVWPNAGVFHFLIQEVQPTNAAALTADPLASLTYDTRAHILTVEVRNCTVHPSGLVATNVVATPGTPGTPGTPDIFADPPYLPGRWVAGEKYERYIPGDAIAPIPGTPGRPGTPGTIEDASQIDFRNIFTRDIEGSLTDPALAITKTVTDTTGLADLNLRFPISTTLTKPTQAFEHDPAFAGNLTGTAAPVVVNDQGQPVYIGSPAERVPVTVTRTGAGTVVSPFAFTVTTTLAHGERLAFPELVAGTTFGATETQHPTYTGHAIAFSAAENRGTFGESIPANVGVDVVVPELADHFVSDRNPMTPSGQDYTLANRVDFHNDLVHSPITGLVIGSMPILAALIAITVVLAMMVAARSRRRIEALPVAF